MTVSKGVHFKCLKINKTVGLLIDLGIFLPPFGYISKCARNCFKSCLQKLASLYIRCRPLFCSRRGTPKEVNEPRFEIPAL